MRREFSAKVEEQARERAGGRCEECGGLLMPGRSEVDHIKPCELGGGNELANARVLCLRCHMVKTVDEDLPQMRKADKKAKAASVEHVRGLTEIQRRFGIKPD